MTAGFCNALSTLSTLINYFSALRFQAKTHTELKPWNFGFMFQIKKDMYRNVVLRVLTIWLGKQRNCDSPNAQKPPQ